MGSGASIVNVGSVAGLTAHYPVAYTASKWGVRRESDIAKLSTFEAIARAFGILESLEVQSQLEALFTHMVAQTHQARGYARAAKLL